MAHNIDEEIADLRQMTVKQLRSRHGEVCGRPACSAHKQHLVRRIAWWLQALAEGDLSQRARLRAEQLIEADMAERFGFQYPLPPEVHLADRQMLALEMKYIRMGGLSA